MTPLAVLAFTLATFVQDGVESTPPATDPVVEAGTPSMEAMSLMRDWAMAGPASASDAASGARRAVSNFCMDGLSTTRSRGPLQETCRTKSLEMTGG